MIRLGYLEERKTSLLVCIACFFTYTVFVMTRNTYSASIAAIVKENIMTKTSAGTISSCFYLLYGVTGLAGGYMADRVSPFKLILAGIAGSILSNIVMAMSSSFVPMLIAWSFNGAIQFGVWPGVLKIVTTVLCPEHRQKAMKYITFCFCGGSIISYFTAMVVLDNLNWQTLFYISVAVLCITFALFLYASCKAKKRIVGNETELVKADEKKAAVQQKNDVSLFKIALSSGLIILFIPSIIRAMLDLGLKTWVPTMIMETYSVSPGFASMLTSVLLFINILGNFLAIIIFPKRIKSLPMAMFLLFAVSLPLLFLLLMTGKIHLAIIVVLLTLITTFMNAENPFFNVNLPAAFAFSGKIGLITGIINCFGALGSVLAGYLYGMLAENFSWHITISVWILLAVTGVIATLIAAVLWKNFFSKGKYNEK